MARLKLAVLALITVTAAACGGSTSAPSGTGQGTTAGGQPLTVVAIPQDAELEPGASVRFEARLDGAAVTPDRWVVDEGGGGTIDGEGVYTAPAAEGTFHVRAEKDVPAGSPLLSRAASSSTVHVKRKNANVAVSVSPGTASLPALGRQGFTAAVTGTSNLSVTWSVKEGAGCGSVTSSGLYTAPSAGASCTVVATSVVDPTKSGAAAVTVSAPIPITVAVSPANPSVLAGGSLTFTATVANTTNTAVTWSVPPGSGTINATTGVYVAPATAGTYVVVATSVADPTKTGSTSITVTAPPPPAVAISISPATVTLDACTGQVFTATVANTTNTAVTWYVTETGGGTVTSGAYVAPSTPGTYHVVAVSQADTSKTAQATITVNAQRVLSVAVSPGTASLQAAGTVAFSATVTTTCGSFPAG